MENSGKGIIKKSGSFPDEDEEKKSLKKKIPKKNKNRRKKTKSKKLAKSRIKKPKMVITSCYKFIL